MTNTLRKFLAHQGLTDTALNGRNLIATLTSQVQSFVFSYSIRHRNLLAWSGNAGEILGVRDLAIIRDGNVFLRHVHPDDRYPLMNDLERALKGEAPYRATYRWLRPDNNELRWIHCRAGVVERERLPIFEGLLFDITEEYSGFSSPSGPDSIGGILSAFPTRLIILDLDRRIRKLNAQQLSKPFNFGDAQIRLDLLREGRLILDAFVDGSRQQELESAIKHTIEAGVNCQIRYLLEEGAFGLEIYPIAYKGTVDGVLLMISEISHTLENEKLLAKFQKMEGLGLLAEGVAHNFNNALQGILGQAAVIANHPENPEMVRRAGNAITEIVTRSSELTRQLMLFGEKSVQKVGSLDLNLIAMAALNDLQDIFEEGIRVAVSFGNVPKVLGERADLQKIIESMIRNAHENLSNLNARRGHITIRSGQTVLSGTEAQAGTYAALTIAFNGDGISPSAEPEALGFEANRALSLAQKMGGTIKIENRGESGRKITLLLPAHGKGQSQIHSKIETNGSIPQILIVDDDEIVLQTMATIVRDLGFACVTAENSVEAIKLIESNSDSLQLVLMDLIMPGVDGVSLLKSVRQINNRLKIVGFSGASTEQLKPMLEAGASAILRKPVGPHELLQMLSEYVRR